MEDPFLFFSIKTSLEADDQKHSNVSSNRAAAHMAGHPQDIHARMSDQAQILIPGKAVPCYSKSMPEISCHRIFHFPGRILPASFLSLDRALP
jgi:hypothetical protein